MAGRGDYYSSSSRRSGDNRGGNRSGGGSLLGVVVDALVLCVTFVVAVLLLASLLSKWISPESAVVFAFLGLVFPILYILNLLCALYWIVRWNKMFVLSLVVALVGLPNVNLFYRPEIRKQVARTAESRPDLRVMSFNVMGFDKSYDNNQGTSAERVAEMINGNGVDVVCMQEFMKTNDNMDRLTAALGDMNHSVYYNISPGAKDGNGFGTAIYSLYPIVRSGTVLLDSAFVRSVWADVKINSDTVRFVTSHLQTTSINKKDRNDIFSTRIVTDTLRHEKVKALLERLSQNYRRRAAQADSLALFVASSPYETVVCGDFNDTPMSYVYHRIRGNMLDAFVEKGRGTDATYNGFLNMFRIDYVLVSDGFEVVNYTPSDVIVSDHRPVVVGLGLVKNKLKITDEQ